VKQVWPLCRPTADRGALSPQHNEPPQIIVDSVVYLCVPCLPEVTEHSEYELIEFNPEIPLGMWSLVTYLKIPMLILEFVTDPSGRGGGEERHMNHLLMAMSTGSAFSAFLKMKHPIFGLLIDRSYVKAFIGWRSESENEIIKGEGRQPSTSNCSSSSMNYKHVASLDMNNALDCLRLRLLTRSLVALGADMKETHWDKRDEIIKELEDGTFYRWRDRSPLNELLDLNHMVSESPPSIEAWRQDV